MLTLKYCLDKNENWEETNKKIFQSSPANSRLSNTENI